MKILLLVLSGFIIVFLTGCVGNMTVATDYNPQTKGDTPLASVPPLKVKLLNFEYERSQPLMIGHREAAGGVPMGNVYSERPVPEIIRDAVKAELIRNGHSIVTDNEDISIGGEIRKFRVGTDVTAMYWDVIGEVSFAIEVKGSTSEKSGPFGPYTGKKVERTYLNPGESIVKSVLAKSLEDAMSSMSHDPKLIKALNNYARTVK
jgi:Uncharacterized lipoprotein